MKPKFVTAGLLPLVLAGLMVGCGNSEDAEVPAAAEEAAEAPSAQAPAPEMQAQWSQYERALEKSDYENAAAALLKAEMSKPEMTQQEWFDQTTRMRELSKQLADAAAHGDPNAMRALELLRQRQMMRMQGR